MSQNTSAMGTDVFTTSSIKIEVHYNQVTFASHRLRRAQPGSTSGLSHLHTCALHSFSSPAVKEFVKEEKPEHKYTLTWNVTRSF